MRTAVARTYVNEFPKVNALLDANQAALDEVMMERALQLPTMAGIAAQQDPKDPRVAAERALSRELQRKALVHGDWDPYIAHLNAQGRIYARLGVSLADWYALVHAYRNYLVPVALSEPEPAPLVLAITAFVDVALAEIGAAYLAEKQSLVAAAEGERELYLKLLKKCPLGLTLHRIDSDGKRSVVHVNDAIAELRDGAFAESPDRESISARFDADIRRALATGEAVESQEAIGGRVFRQWAVPLDEVHAGGIHVDITERDRMNRALREANADLERSNRDLYQFAYIASHDLRAPLRDVDNLSKWLADDLGETLPEASARHLVRLRARVSRMERLLEDLLQYSRAGKTSTAAEAVSLEDAVAAAVEVTGPPPDFEVIAAAPPMTVITPRAPLEMVLRNLIGNAIKHHHRQKGRVEVAWARDGARVRLSVLDDGPGIAPEYHQRVFEMFQTLAPRDAVEGSGMGLAVVKRVVEAYGGSVGVVSEGDRSGSEFWFTWPVEWRPEGA